MKRSLVIVLTLLADPAPAGAKEPLPKAEKKIVAAAQKRLPETLAALQKAVDIPSATENLAGVRAVGELYRPQLEAMGFRTRWIEMPAEMKRAGHLVAEREGKKGKRVLLIGHLDTVLDGPGWRQDGERAHGSGTVDMKGGNAIILAALQALQDVDALKDRRLAVIFTGDEEAPGSPLAVSRGDLVELGRRSDAALAFEAAVGNTATVARRGVSTWTLTCTGTGAHSSGIFHEDVGHGAVFECARILDGFQAELSAEPNLTFNPSVMLGGTDLEHDPERHSGRAGGKTNIVASRAVVEGDLRFLTVEQREMAKARMEEITSRHLPRTGATLTFRDGYPSMAPTPGNHELLGVLDEVSRALGYGPVTALPPGERGAGDVSFVAADVSGLDGLGAQGTGSHTPSEQLDLTRMPELIERTALLVYRLTR